MVAHPPCTHLAVSGARWFPAKRASGEQQAALDFVRLLLDAPIPHIALENPVSIISSKIRKPDQVIQPWQFGHGETKATCLWLRGLPALKPSNVVSGRSHRIHEMSPGKNRGHERSRTLPGIAAAMADKWSLGNCSSGGISSRCKSVTLMVEGKSCGPVAPDNDAPAVKLVRRTFGGREYVRACNSHDELLAALENVMRCNHELGAISKPIADEARAPNCQGVFHWFRSRL